jgi:poly-beta-hydroxybutyrate-responsive repressor
MIDLDTCACSGKNLAKLVRPAVLLLLRGQDLHGYDIAQRLAGVVPSEDMNPDSTAIYRALRAMDEEGLVTSSWMVSDTGPAKRSYHITEDGEACARRWVETLREYQRAIDSLLRLADGKA